MKYKSILVIATEQAGQYGGSPIRNYNLLKQIAKVKNLNVRLIYLTKPIKTRSHDLLVESVPGLSALRVEQKPGSVIDKLKAIAIKRRMPDYEAYRMSGISSAVLKEVKRKKPDFIQLEQLHSYYAIRDIMPILKAQGITIVLDAHNVELEAFKAAVNHYSFFMKIAGYYVLRNMKKLEDEAIKAVDFVLTCSPSDRRYFEKIKKPGFIINVPNGVDTSYFASMPLSNEQSLIFTGGTNYPPNEEALKFYFEKIHPKLKIKIPALKVYLLGGKTKPWIRRIAMHDEGIIIPGFVEDVREYLKKARVCISPTRVGSGSSLKILEYLACGKPVVTTQFGARGVQCANDIDILITESATKFANLIIDLMKNDKKSRSLGRNARKTAELYYDWDVIGREYVKLYMGVDEKK